MSLGRQASYAAYPAELVGLGHGGFEVGEGLQMVLNVPRGMVKAGSC